nr:uncharacterized protein LOC115492431 isoform X2 [Taeniopygia guttata]
MADKKSQKPFEVMWKMLKEMEQAGQDLDGNLDYLEAVLENGLKFLEDVGDNPAGESDLASQPTFRMEALGDAEEMDQTSLQKEAHPGGSSGSVPTSAAGRKAMPGTGTGTGDAAGPTTPVPDAQNSLRSRCYWETHCLLQLIAGLLFLEFSFMFTCVGIWCYCKRKRSASAASQDQMTSAMQICSCHQPSPSQFPTCLPQLHYPLTAGDMLPPPITEPSVPKGAGPGVQPGQEVQPSCQGRA